MINRKHLILPLLLIAVCIYLLYSVYLDINRQTVSELHNEQMVHARQSAAGLKSFFNNYETMLKYLSGTSQVINMDDKGERLLSHFYSSHANEIKAVTRVDSAGKVVFTVPYNRELIGRDISYQAHIKQLIRERKPLLSNVFYTIQGYRAVAFYVPVFKNNTFAGGLAVLIPFDDLSGKYVKEVRVRQNGFAWVISNTGNVLYHPNPDFTDKPVSQILKDTAEASNLIRAISGSERGNFTFLKGKYSYYPAEYYADFYSMKVTDKFWTIIVSTPKDEVFETMRGFIFKWLSVFAMLLGLSIFFMYYTGKARTIIKEEAKRRKAEEALKSSERKFRTLVDVIPDGILLLDTSGKVLSCNPKANELLGNSEHDRTLFGKNLKDMILPEEQDKAEKSLRDAHLYGLTKNIEYSIVRPDGSIFPAEVSLASVPVKNGQQENITAVIRDITERKENEQTIIEAKEKAERSNLLKSEFLAQMSHEIRSPINSILSFTSLIKEELFDKVSEELKMGFSAIENAGRRIIRTIGLILNMSEIQTGNFEVLLKKVNLVKDILEKVYLEYLQPAAEKNLELYFQNNTSGDVFVYADEYTIGQIFNNLVDNAIKYTDKGSITIVLCLTDNKTMVEVRDTGIGISEDYLPNLFSPFSQEEQGYTRKYEGNGLGLALVKKYCEVNNIMVEVESKKGMGSTFRIIFNEPFYNA